MPFKILVLCNVLLLTAGQAADVRNRQDSESQNTNEKTARNEPDASGENNQNKSASRLVLKASKLRECSVYGPDEEKLGTTVELVVDFRAGRVRYAVLSYGGFMGIGEKFFAVPYDAFHYTRDKTGTWLRLDIEKKQLRNAPGFSPKAWPDFADQYWSSTVNRHYNASSTSRTTDQNETSQAGDDSEQKSDQEFGPAYKVGEILGLAVKTQSSEEGGTLSDLLVDAKDGRIASAIISSGGMLGIGDEKARVPLDRLTLHRSQKDESQYWFVYSAEKPSR